MDYHPGLEDQIDPIHLRQIYEVYHRKTLLEPSRTKGFGVENGNNIPDLQLLAKLQHFGAATGLVDLTWDFLTSIWFASQTPRDETKKESDGMVFVVDLSESIGFRRLTNEEESLSIERIFSLLASSKEQLFWEPVNRGEASPRIFRQKSVFVIENPLMPIESYRSIKIQFPDKEKILEELKDFFSIDRGTMFDDIHGFSSVNDPYSPVEGLENAVNYLEQGKRFHRIGEYQSAVSSYDKCIDLDDNVSEPYLLRGNAKTELRDYDGAIKDFDSAIQHKGRLYLNMKQPQAPAPYQVWPLYFNRGNAKFAQQNFIEAVLDYNEAEQLCRQANQIIPYIFFNRGNANCMQNRLEEADKDFQEAARHNFSGALYNRGNTLVLLGRFEEAIHNYNEAFSNGYNHLNLHQNRVCADLILQSIRYEEGQIPQMSYSGHNPPFLTTAIVKTKSPNRNNGLHYFFQGNIGNMGNQGGADLPGTSGFSGLPSFVVKVQEVFDPPESNT